MKFWNTKWIQSIAIPCLLLVSCSSSHDEEPDPVAPENPGGTTTAVTKYGLDRQAVLDYFSSSLKDEDATFAAESPLTTADLAEASDYVWDIWRTAVKRASGERLPQLTSHYKLSDWGSVKTPDATWTVPEGGMAVFYGSKGERPAEGYPLFLFLHGSGSDANGEWTTCLSWAQVFKDGPSAYFVPKSPQGGTGTRWFQPSKQAKWEQLWRQAMAQDNINPRKIFVASISEGAYGSQRLASFYPDYLAGAAPIAGGEFLQNCPPENLANVAFTLHTGALDASYARDLLTKRVDDILNGLAAAHPGYYTHKVDLEPGAGHGCTYTESTPWVVNYTRNATPKYFYYENFGMGDINGEPRRYRDAFYNVRILEPSDDRSNDLARTAYEMEITGNNINLNVRNVALTINEPVTPATGTVNIGVDKSYTAATTGRVRIYLDSNLVDLGQPVTVTVNGAQKFSGAPTVSGQTIVESCALFFDPLRLFPAYVDVDVK